MLLKRGTNGAYVSVEPFHLFRYLDEQTFRYNKGGPPRTKYCGWKKRRPKKSA